MKPMKKTLRWGLLALGLLVAAPVASAQDGDEALRDNYKEKLEKEFVSKIEWSMSFEQARASAKKQGKLVRGYFTRSYAP
jgi:hypothetical protein